MKAILLSSIALTLGIMPNLARAQLPPAPPNGVNILSLEPAPENPTTIESQLKHFRGLQRITLNSPSLKEGLEIYEE